MGMEIGGRSDKRGNEYENRYLVKLLLRMVDEDLSSIVIEPVGENSAEYIAETADGKRFYYQCKASNGVADHWRISDLKKYDVWKRAKEIILSDEVNCYCFVSPVPYDDIDEICYRARTNSSPKEFFEKQIKDKRHGSMVSKIASELELDLKQAKDKNEFVYILSHCYFELVPNGRDALLDLESLVGLYFTGDQRAARVQLGQFANSAERYGVTFNPADVVMYMRDIFCLQIDFVSRTLCQHLICEFLLFYCLAPFFWLHGNIVVCFICIKMNVSAICIVVRCFNQSNL